MTAKVAVITGAGSGIGAALALVIARRRVHVVCGDLDTGAAAATVARIRALGRDASSATVDVTSAEDVDALASRTFEQAGRVDLWVNNAGIAVGGAANELELADFRRVVEVNLMGVIHGVRAIYPRMIRQRSGHIVNIASVAGLAPYPLALPYTTTKHAVVGLSQALRAEARAHGIAVSVACPGAIDTPIWQRSPVRGALAEAQPRWLARLPRRMSAERCAEAIAAGIAANRAIIPVTAEAHAAYLLTRISPALAGWISHRLARAVIA